MATVPTVYVYKLPASLTGAYLYDNLTAGDHDYHFRGELELTERFRAMPQAPPETADMLLVPFMITQAFTKLRKGGLGSPGHTKLHEWNDKVVAAMRSAGPYWDTRRTRHALFAQRCAGPPYNRNDIRDRSIKVKTWPMLWDQNVTLLCFEPTTAADMGRGIFIPYGVGHGAGNKLCPAGRELDGPPLASAPRESLLMFAGSIDTNLAREAWVRAMKQVGAPRCRLVLFEKKTRKRRFDPADLEAALRASSFSVHLRGHVGQRKAIMDSIRCGSLPVMASDRTPFPFSDEIDYSAFAVRVGEKANATRVLAALERIPEAQLRRMRTAMAKAAHVLDAGPHGGLAQAVLARFVRVADRHVVAVPDSTRTPIKKLAQLLEDLKSTGWATVGSLVRASDL